MTKNSLLGFILLTCALAFVSKAHASSITGDHDTQQVAFDIVVDDSHGATVMSDNPKVLEAQNLIAFAEGFSQMSPSDIGRLAERGENVLKDQGIDKTALDVLRKADEVLRAVAQSSTITYDQAVTAGVALLAKQSKGSQ